MGVEGLFSDPHPGTANHPHFHSASARGGVSAAREWLTPSAWLHGSLRLAANAAVQPVALKHRLHNDSLWTACGMTGCV